MIIRYAIYCEELLESESEMMTSGTGSDSAESGMLAPDNTTQLIIVAGNETNIVFPNLVPYTMYSCYASASTSAGEGNFTVPVAARTDESGKFLSYLSTSFAFIESLYNRHICANAFKI